jgi:hypothetical protein
MPAQGVHRPEAQDSNALEIHPTREFESCNGLLDDFAALNRFYEAQGYILLRQVLDQGSVARARDEMLAVAASIGLVREGDPTGTWTGKPLEGRWEESPRFSGISRRLIDHPVNQAVMAKVMGEKACMVPNVQYRIYPPDGPVTMVHQDGFFSPGIHDYRPVWIPLLPCPREVGGLMVAVAQNQRGYLHNVAKGPPFPIPADEIPPESWATTDYMPGDVLIVHPCSPHASRPNRSTHLRLTFDTRVQSAARPSAVSATVTGVTPDTITVDVDGFGSRCYRVDAETFVRVRDPGIREPFERFAEVTVQGMRLLLVADGDYAVMLRKAAEA